MSSIDSANGDTPEAVYNYSNSRPLKVFGLAAIAALFSLVLVGTAWSVLDTATEQNKLAAPPDLKKIVQVIERDSDEFLPAEKAAKLETHERQGSLPDKNAENDQAVNNAV